MMSRKDYVAVAAIIADLRRDHDGETAWLIAGRLATMFGHDNPRFDRARFLKACAVES